MHKAILLFFSVGLCASILYGCSDDELCCAPPPVMDVSISYINEKGTDLLVQDTVSLASFNIYYLQKNSETGEFERKSAASNQFSFYTDRETGRGALRVFPNREFVNDTSITLIEFPNDQLDTLKVQGRKEGRGAIAEKIWYNGEHIWSNGSNPPRRYFTFVKTVW